MCLRPDLTPTIKNIRSVGMTVKGWSTKRGFRYQTVVKVLNGFAGKRKIGVTADILNALKKDGYYEEKPQKESAETGGRDANNNN